MKVRACATLIALLGPLGFSMTATAATLPQILATSSNQVPKCVTPGRLTAYLRSRNAGMASKYDKIAVDYMRHGEELGLRWDYGFFQMLVETASLHYTGDVRAKQNNFAGLGATGGGARGESFGSVSDGVRAHLEHVLMYTGTHVDDPVATRTRKVQAWRVLDKWRSRIRGPMTFTHLTQKWSPGDRGYPRDIAAIAKLFHDNHCDGPDPQPAMLVEARAGSSGSATQGSSGSATQGSSGSATQGSSGSTTQQAVTATKTTTVAVTTQNPSTAATGTSNGTRTGTSTGAPAGTRKVVVLNPPTKDQVVPSSKTGAGSGTTTTGAAKGSSSRSSTSTNATPAKKKASNCRVWTASYGGPKALIIKAVKKGITNYTVLDVNEGREKREATAYISAYAKGGTTLGEYGSPEKALKQAFHLCPEG